MRRKIYNGLTICFLVLTFFSAFTGEAGAQKPRGSQNKKPSEQAKKLAAQGDSFYRQKDYRSAAGKYGEAIVASPVYPYAYFWKGNAHHLLNEYDQAVKDLNTAFEQGHPPIKVYEVRWEAHYRMKNYDAALGDVEAALRAEPANNYFILALADVRRMKGEYQEAITAYNKALPGSRNSGDIYYFIASSYSKLGEYAQQNSAAAEAVKNSTRYTGESYVLMADAYVKEKKPTEAIAAYERALNVKPEMPEVYTALASLYESQNRINDAIATLRRGIKLYPENGDMFVALTWYYSLIDRHAEAVNIGQQAARLAPNNYAAHTNLCRAYNDTKLYRQAAEACNKALALQPNDGETYLYLARAYDFQNKPDAATQYYKKAVSGLLEYTRNKPDYPDGWYLLGNAFYADGQREKAIEAYKRNLQLSPNFAKGRVNLGYMYFLGNNLTAAREQYDTLLKIDPPAAERLKQLMDKK